MKSSQQFVSSDPTLHRSRILLAFIMFCCVLAVLASCGGNSTPPPPPPPTLPSATSLPASCAAGAVGSNYSCQISVSNGSGPFTWTAKGLPKGLSLVVSADTTSATITGTIQPLGAVVHSAERRAATTPAVATDPTSSVSVTVTVTDAKGLSSSVTFNITVTFPGLAISTTTLPTGTAGTAYSATATATGGVTPYSWTISGLPAGLTSASATPSAIISGITDHVGTFSITATVSDAESTPATMSVTLSLTMMQAATLMISTTMLPNGTVNSPYSATATATGGVTPYTWSVASGTLPAGLALSSAGVISGTPTTSATSSFTVQATDAESPAQTSTQALSITINTASSGLNITTTSPLPGATLSSAYNTQLTATGGVLPYTWSLATGSALPAGLTLNSASPSATISGTPTATGTFQFTVKVTDSATPTPSTVSVSFLLTVSGSSTLNCPATVNLTLCGSYLMGIGGFVGTTGPVAMGASFVADNSGHIVSGVEDINGVSGAQANVSITGGSYAMDASGDGRGVLTLIDSNAGSRTFRFVLESAANPGGAAIEEFDASGRLAAGSLQGPGTPPFATIPANTIFAVQLGGVNGAGQRAGMLGEFQVGSSGWNGATGSFNSMTGEHVVTNTAGTVNKTLAITGSCSAPDPNTGRGTVQITISGGTPFTSTTLNFVFYSVGTSATGLLGLFLGETDAIAANQPILGGLAQVVPPGTSGFNACAAPGACILAGVGTTDGTITTGHAVALLVRAVATGTATSGTIADVLDENFGGTITSAGVSPYTSYAIDANGVGTVSGTGPTIHAVADGRFMDESVSVIMGDTTPQNSTSFESPGAPYIIGESLGTGGNGATPAAHHVLGVLTPSAASAGTFSGALDVISSAGSTAGAAASGSYTVSSTGRGTGTANLTGSTSGISVVIYCVRHRRFSVLDMQSSDPYVLGARLQ